MPKFTVYAGGAVVLETTADVKVVVENVDGSPGVQLHTTFNAEGVVRDLVYDTKAGDDVEALGYEFYADVFPDADDE